MRDPASHANHPWINWVQAHGTREPLDRRPPFAQPVFFIQPPHNHASAKLESSTSAQSSKLAPQPEVANNVRQRKPAGGEHDRVILAQLNCALNEPLRPADQSMPGNRRARANVRGGTEADLAEALRDVRFTPNNGHRLLQELCPLSTKLGSRIVLKPKKIDQVIRLYADPPQGPLNSLIVTGKILRQP